MPAGTPWLTEEPTWSPAPTQVLYRVHDAQFPATAPNPVSKARFALTSSHAMFYAADQIEGALWEALLRYTAIGPKGHCDLPTAKLKGQVLSCVRLADESAKVLSLSRPALLLLFPDGDGPAVQAVKELTTTPDHASTHAEAAALYDCLQAIDPPVRRMPILSWKSRQFEDSTVYLSYHPKDVTPETSGWVQIGESQPLDSPVGINLIRTALQNHGFMWTPVNTFSTESLPEEADAMEESPNQSPFD